MSTLTFKERIQSFCNPDYIDRDLALIDDLKNVHFGKDGEVVGEYDVIIFVKSGVMNVKVNDEWYNIRHRHLMILRYGQHISSPSFSEDFSGHGVIMTARYGQSIISVAGNIWNYLVKLESKPILEIPEPLQNILLSYYRLLKMEVYHVNNIYYSEVVGSIIRAMLYSLISDMKREIHVHSIDFTDIDNKYKGSKQSLALFHRFIDMLMAENSNARKIEYYAERLCVTPKYLSTVCKQVSNRTAHEWICDAIVNGIENYLRYSDRSIKEIAIYYGFTTLSFFSKFVKDHLGKSPTEIRKPS